MIVRGAVLALTITIAPQTQAPNWAHPLPYEVMRSLSNCETGSNLKHRTLSYVGAFGFTHDTFRKFNPYGKPAHQLTYGEQSKVLDHAFWYGKRKENGEFRWAVGPWGHGCFKRLWKTSPALRHAVCNNGKQSVRRWCRK